MSFFNRNNRNTIPGRICGSPLTGLCHRTCIDVNKVIDACNTREQLDGQIIHLKDNSPSNPVTPLTFIAGHSMCAKALVSNVGIERFEDRPNFAHVCCEVAIPLKITYIDANNVKGSADSEIIVPLDVALFMPKDSLIPMEITADASCVCTDGRFAAPNDFICTTCVNIILKEVYNTQLLIPSYGHCHVPRCSPFSKSPCEEFFELPLHPNEHS